MFTRFTPDLHRVYLPYQPVFFRGKPPVGKCVNLVHILSKRWTNLTNSEQTNSHCCTKSAHGKLCFGISAPLCKPIAFKSSNITGVLQGPTWQKSRAGAVLLANRRYDGSRSRKTKGSLADTFQCNIWRRAQTPHRLTHCLHGCAKNYNGFTGKLLP